MAKGARNKYKKRMRSAKAAHLFAVRGKDVLQRLNGRLNDPNYQMQSEYTLPPNAYLEPDNPLAVFPQVKKPQILDFRNDRIANGAIAAIGVNRKMLSKNTKKSKYSSVVKTAEMLEQEANGEAEMVIEEEPQIVQASTKTTKEDMMELAMLTEKMSLEKKQRKRKAKGDDIDMEDDKAPKVSSKSKAIQKTRRDQNRYKKSRK